MDDTIQYDKISKRNKVNGKYAKWETCDNCGSVFVGGLDANNWDHSNEGDIICWDCVVKYGSENYEVGGEDKR